MLHTGEGGEQRWGVGEKVPSEAGSGITPRVDHTVAESPNGGDLGMEKSIWCIPLAGGSFYSFYRW